MDRSFSSHHAPVPLIKKRMDDLFGGSNLYKRDTEKISAFRLDKSIKSTVIELHKLFPDYMMGAEWLHASAQDGVSYCVYRTACGIYALIAVKSSSRRQFPRFEYPNFSICCDYDHDGLEEQWVFVLGVPLRFCTGCGEALEKSYKCSVCRCAGLHVRYCSKSCQVKHWPVHKALCGGKKK